MDALLPFIVVLLGVGLAPFLAMMATSFAKIVIVLALLRQALGLQQAPPNMLLNGIAIIMTVYVMAPVGLQINERMIERGMSLSSLTELDQLNSMYDVASAPMRNFLVEHADMRDRRFFARTAQKLWPEPYSQNVNDTDMLILLPAFTVSELTEAFRIGFVLFLAFVMVDLIIAVMLVSFGMNMVSPTLISVPFKVLLFVVLEGWTRLLQGMIMGYY